MFCSVLVKKKKRKKNISLMLSNRLRVSQVPYLSNLTYASGKAAAEFQLEKRSSVYRKHRFGLKALYGL